MRCSVSCLFMPAPRVNPCCRFVSNPWGSYSIAPAPLQRAGPPRSGRLFPRHFLFLSHSLLLSCSAEFCYDAPDFFSTPAGRTLMTRKKRPGPEDSGTVAGSAPLYEDKPPALASHPAPADSGEKGAEGLDQLSAILGIVKDRTGHDFASYKVNTV